MTPNMTIEPSTWPAGTPWTVASDGAQQPVHDPRLAADLGGDPAELVGDERPDDGEHEHPQQPALLEQRPAPAQDERDQRQRDEEEPRARPSGGTR